MGLGRRAAEEGGGRGWREEGGGRGAGREVSPRPSPIPG